MKLQMICSLVQAILYTMLVDYSKSPVYGGLRLRGMDMP